MHTVIYCDNQGIPHAYRTPCERDAWRFYARMLRNDRCPYVRRPNTLPSA